MSTNVVIRPATRADLPRLGRLGALLVEVHHAFDSKRFLPMRNRTPADYAAFLIEQLDQADVVLLVAEEAGDVVGYVYGSVEGYDYMALRGPAGVIQDIVVDPGNRGRGVGARLLESVLRELRARGARQVVLSTADKNAPAQRLFERAGFRRTMVEMTNDDEP
jgi:ribosomal protein S18 acetylase RimI-like enzyme